MSKQAKLISDYIELPTLELTVPVQTQGTTVLLGTRVSRQINVCQVGNSILDNRGPLGAVRDRIEIGLWQFGT